MPRISVIMAVYNAGPFVRDAVGCILAQTYRDFELIAVDDASSDSSLSIVESFGDPRIRVIRHSINCGAALSRNAALAAAQGEFIAIMDADDLCVPTRLERQLDYLEENPKLGLVGCGVYENIDVHGAILHTSHLPIDNKAVQVALLERWCLLHSSLMFRSGLVPLAGVYRPAFEPLEDYDFVLRLVEHAEVFNIPERLVSYRLNPNGLSAAGRAYRGEISEAAIRLAIRRRKGRSEHLEAEIPRLIELKERCNSDQKEQNASASHWALTSRPVNDLQSVLVESGPKLTPKMALN